MTFKPKRNTLHPYGRHTFQGIHARATNILNNPRMQPSPRKAIPKKNSTNDPHQSAVNGATPSLLIQTPLGRLIELLWASFLFKMHALCHKKHSRSRAFSGTGFPRRYKVDKLDTIPDMKLFRDTSGSTDAPMTMKKAHTRERSTCSYANTAEHSEHRLAED